MERSDGSRIVKRLDLSREYRKNLGALEKWKKRLPMFFGVLGCCAGEGWPQYMWEIRRGTCQLIFYQTFQFLVFRDQFWAIFWVFLELGCAGERDAQNMWDIRRDLPTNLLSNLSRRLRLRLAFLAQIPYLRKYDYSIVTCQHQDLWFQFQISNEIYVNVFALSLRL